MLKLKSTLAVGCLASVEMKHNVDEQQEECLRKCGSKASKNGTNGLCLNCYQQTKAWRQTEKFEKPKCRQQRSTRVELTDMLDQTQTLRTVQSEIAVNSNGMQVWQSVLQASPLCS
ncbi:conserved hypothetical protein [Trichinella spiralis]|uniref:hypothetical protein n=1 Tax=Trichinella spiralis TaxID=6334 RepID=UPI0001EFC27B|nr:conserved hypothetical protein [Trichinella spiralis]